MKDFRPSVLLVDDNETDILISRKILEISGFASQIASSGGGKAALHFLKDRLANAEALPDVIFLDINMPMLDGFGFLAEFEKMAPEFPKSIEIIVLSSSDSQHDIDRMAAHPHVVKFITKPISAHSIRSLITA